MGFSRRIQYFLVHVLGLSNKAARELIESGKVEINGTVMVENCIITDDSEIKVNGKVERTRKEFVYYRFYKPRGFESTLNKSIEGNISAFFDARDTLAIAGRLDKQSEGLLLLSNNGKWIEHLCHPKSGKEKEYFVTLDKSPDESFIHSFSRGVNIGNYITQPCHCEPVAENEIRVILTEGKNRQIRKMCKRLGYKVLKLKRVRVDKLELGDLKEGESLGIKSPLI